MPNITEETANQSRLAQNMRQLFERITQRHEKSRSINGAAVVASGSHDDIVLNGDIDAVNFVLQDELLDEVGGLGTASFLTYNATLEKHRG